MTPFNEKNIKQIRLSCGASLIGYVIKIDDERGQFHLEKPYLILPLIDVHEGMPVMGKIFLRPFMEMTDNNVVPIAMHAIVSVHEASHQGKAQYLQECFSDKRSGSLADTIITPKLFYENPTPPETKKTPPVKERSHLTLVVNNDD